MTATSVFFLFLYQSLYKFWKIDEISLASFHWENLKILIEIFCQKLIVSNVILAFLVHLKAKFSSANHGGRDIAPPLFKIFGSAPVVHIKCNNLNYLDHRYLQNKFLLFYGMLQHNSFFWFKNFLACCTNTDHKITQWIDLENNHKNFW